MADVLDKPHKWHDGHSRVAVCEVCQHEGACCLMVNVEVAGGKHKAICRACFIEVSRALKSGDSLVR